MAIMTICPEHGDKCLGISCSAWKKQRRKDAEELSELLLKAHEARQCEAPLNQMLTALSGDVPAVRAREEDPSLMIWAYALVVNQLLERK